MRGVLLIDSDGQTELGYDYSIDRVCNKGILAVMGNQYVYHLFYIPKNYNICVYGEIRTLPKSCKDFVLPLHYSPLNLNIFGGPSLTVSLLCRVIMLLTKNIYG